MARQGPEIAYAPRPGGIGTRVRATLVVWGEGQRLQGIDNLWGVDEGHWEAAG